MLEHKRSVTDTGAEEDTSKGDLYEVCCSFLPAQMRRVFLHYLPRRKENVLLLLFIAVLLLFWVNLELKNSLSQRNEEHCPFPCYGTTCGTCRQKEKVPSVNIFDHLKLKQALRGLPSNKIGQTAVQDASTSDQICKRPNFDLKHDSVKYAFFSLPALNCSAEELFYIDSGTGIFRLDLSKLDQDQELEMCMYYGIERETDSFATYTEPHKKDAEPFDIYIQHDFVRIKCFLKKEKTSNENSDIDLVEGKTNKKDGNEIEHKLNGERDNVKDNVNILRKLLGHADLVLNKNSVIDDDFKYAFRFNKSHSILHFINRNAIKPDKDNAMGNIIQEKVIDLNIPMEFQAKTYVDVNNIRENGATFNIPKLKNDISEEYFSSGILGTQLAMQNEKEKFMNDEGGMEHSADPKQTKNEKDNDNVPEEFKRDRKKKGNGKHDMKGRRSLKYIDDYNVNNDIESLLDSEDEGNQWYPGFYDEMETADFDQFLVQVHPKQSVFERITRTINKLGAKEKREQMNVLIFGLDSLSHLAYQRKLPKTYTYLKNELGSVILDGYNIVGDATTAALIPMLTGLSETELPEVRKSLFDSDFVDTYPLIWKRFHDNGYVTMFAEDEPSISAFNLRLNGFREQPTDHYMRPFWQALWDSDVRRSSSRFCTGNKPNHMFLIDYAKDFFVKYSNVSKFAFVFGCELSHWDNNPVQHMDDDFVEFLKFLKVKGHLDNTLLVVMADHGARYSRVRYTIQGKMEERLPMMALRFPVWFQEKYPQLQKNLFKNSDRLATPFDIHETLRDALNLKRTESPLNLTQRGISLLQPIPINRTCAGASIEMHWCTCLKQLELDVSDKHVQRSANAIMEFINSKTQQVRNLCASLKVSKILQAYLLIPNEMVLMFQKARDEDSRNFNFSQNINIDHTHFQVTMETYPNKGLYEGTVQVNMTASSYTVVADVSRLDLYGNQPRCIQEKYPDLRKYCYCLNKETQH